MRTGLAVTLVTGCICFMAEPDGAHAQLEAGCGQSQSTVRGRIVGVNPAHAERMVVRSSRPCQPTLSDSTGAFTLHVSPGPQVIAAQGIGHCIRPVEVNVSPGGEMTVELEAIALRNSLDDTMILVPHSPYMPPTHSERQCRAQAAYLEANPGIRDLRKAPVVPDPDSVLAIVLRSDQLSSALGDDRPLRFRYWNEPSATRSGSVAGRAYEITDAGGYIVVLSATPSALELQIGRDSAAGIRARVDLVTGAVVVVDRW